MILRVVEVVVAVWIALGVASIFLIAALMARAPVGWEDELGFHEGEQP